MRRLLAGTLPSLLFLSCGPSAESPVQLGMHVSVPQITLDRLDDQLHLRIFPKAALSCNTALGQVFQGATRVTNVFPGTNVSPVIRCDPTRWAAAQMGYAYQGASVASPVDVCFSKTMATHVQVPAGTYVVLIEGSGQAPGGGGGTQDILLGSGCAEITAMAGQSQTVSIEMIEQANVGVCGDGMVQANESCDVGMTPTDACDNKCQFPERRVDAVVTPMGIPHRPSVSWADSQNLLVAFYDDRYAYLHQLDPSGGLIMSPVALANSNVLPATAMSRGGQQFPSVAGTPSGYAAAWGTVTYDLSHFDVDGAIFSYSQIPPATMDFQLNPTSSRMLGTQGAPMALGANGTVALAIFQDGTANTLRRSILSMTAPAVPTGDTLLVTTGAAMTNASNPAVVATGAGFVAVWGAGPTGSRDVYAQAFTPMGAPQGAPAIATVETAADQDFPAVAAHGGDVVIAWYDRSGANPADALGSTVRWRHFTTSLAAMGGDVIGPTTVAGDQITPTVAIAANSVVFVAWENVDDGAIRGRLFQLDGSTVVNRVTGTATDFVVNAAADEIPTGHGARHLPSAAFGGAQLFGVAWEDAGLMQIRARTLRAD